MKTLRKTLLKPRINSKHRSIFRTQPIQAGIPALRGPFQRKSVWIKGIGANGTNLQVTFVKTYSSTRKVVAYPIMFMAILYSLFAAVLYGSAFYTVGTTTQTSTFFLNKKVDLAGISNTVLLPYLSPWISFARVRKKGKYVSKYEGIWFHQEAALLSDLHFRLCFYYGPIIVTTHHRASFNEICLIAATSRWSNPGEGVLTRSHKGHNSFPPLSENFHLIKNSGWCAATNLTIPTLNNRAIETSFDVLKEIQGFL